MGEQIKVSYIVRDQEWTSKAYVDEDTLLGTDKYTDVDVQLEWREEERTYYQVDTWEWDVDRFGEFHRRETE